jgi:hypothetical protein
MASRQNKALRVIIISSSYYYCSVFIFHSVMSGAGRVTIYPTNLMSMFWHFVPPPSLFPPLSHPRPQIIKQQLCFCQLFSRFFGRTYQKSQDALVKKFGCCAKRQRDLVQSASFGIANHCQKILSILKKINSSKSWLHMRWLLKFLIIFLRVMRPIFRPFGNISAAEMTSTCLFYTYFTVF